MKRSELSNAIFYNIKTHYIIDWKIDTNRYPISDNAYLITFWPRFDLKDPYATALKKFGQFNLHHMLKPLADEVGSKAAYFPYQHMGFFAVDFVDSELGYREVGPHVHAVWVMHPDFRQMSIAQLNRLTVQFCGRLNVEKIMPTEADVINSIDYSLKGIMSPDRFYHDRSDMWVPCGPKRKSIIHEARNVLI